MPSIRTKFKHMCGRLSVAYHGFWFVDIPRTSSSSIRIELGKSFGRAYAKKNIVEKEYSAPQFLKDHIPAREMQVLLGRSIWDRIYTFTMVRNPWDRTYSMFQYRLRKERNIPNQWSFQDYVYALNRATCDTEFFKNRSYLYGASEYILDGNDNIIVSMSQLL